MDGRAEGERHALPIELLGNVTRIRNGAGQAVQLRHDQSVALAECSQRLREAGPVPSGSGQPVVRVDPVLGHALANRGYDLRLIQDYLGDRDPRHTAHYTRTAAIRFDSLWEKREP